MSSRLDGASVLPPDPMTEARINEGDCRQPCSPQFGDLERATRPRARTSSGRRGVEEPAPDVTRGAGAVPGSAARRQRRRCRRRARGGRPRTSRMLVVQPGRRQREWCHPSGGTRLRGTAIGRLERDGRATSSDACKGAPCTGAANPCAKREAPTGTGKAGTWASAPGSAPLHSGPPRSLTDGPPPRSAAGSAACGPAAGRRRPARRCRAPTPCPSPGSRPGRRPRGRSPSRASPAAWSYRRP